MSLATGDTGLNVFQVAMMIAELNDQQRQAATTIDGRYLVIAGAGSGKTKTLTVRIANMLANGVRPGQIFCATFTNKAAREMKERLMSITGESIMNQVWMGTFHSLCVRILRRHAHLLGYEQNEEGRNAFVIYDASDCLNLIDRIYKQMNIKDKYKAGLALHYIDDAKNHLFTPDYCLYNKADTPTDEVMAQVYHHYQHAMTQANAMDFGDLIMNVVTLLDEHPEARDYWQNKFRYVMSDEYQDANPAQFQLLSKLAAPHYNIFVVGDPDQSIYAFRGSDISIIMNFERYFSPCTIIKLEINYRSVRNVVHAGNVLISNNPKVYDKVLTTPKEDGAKFDVVKNQNEYTEAAYIAARIKQLVVSGQYEWKDIAILYRASFQSQPFEQLFVHNFIPFKVVGGTSFFEREEIKDLTSYLRAIYNRKDDAAMLRIVNKPTRGIGDTSMKAIQVYAQDHKVSVYRALKNVESIPTIKKAAAGKIKTFLTIMEHFEEELKKDRSLQTYVRYVMEHSGLMKLYRERAPKEKNGHERVENLDEFINLIAHYEEENLGKTLEEFMQEMSLVTDYIGEQGEDNAVRLMTMHGSKGLEFPVVIGPGLNEGVFPSWRSNSEKEVEEERRLAYVLITRAEKEVILSYVTQRQSPNGKGQQTYQPSRFLEELPQDIVNNITIGGAS